MDFQHGYNGMEAPPAEQVLAVAIHNLLPASSLGGGIGVSSVRYRFFLEFLISTDARIHHSKHKFAEKSCFHF